MQNLKLISRRKEKGKAKKENISILGWEYRNSVKHILSVPGSENRDILTLLMTGSDTVDYNLEKDHIIWLCAFTPRKLSLGNDAQKNTKKVLDQNYICFNKKKIK